MGYLLFCLVPFDEDDKDRSVWFLDHDYLENMYHMFKKVNGELCDFEMFHALMDISSILLLKSVV